MTTIPIFYEGLPPWLSMTAVLAGWVLLLWAVTRLLFRRRARIQCPIKRREASVVFVRGPDGATDDVASCSQLAEDPAATCEQECLRMPPGEAAQGTP